MKRAVFIGRWSPFHKGHLAIMKKKIDQGIPLLILVRDTHYDVYPAQLRKRMIEATMSKLKVNAKVMIIDDIESVNYGRGVGYKVNEIKVSEDIKRISATQIRDMIEKKDNTWKEFIPKGADKVLEDYMKGAGIVVWFTGIPRAGKSQIADLVSLKLEEAGIKTQNLNSKELRSTISKDLKFTKEDRKKNLERATYIAKLLSKNGSVVLCSFISPYQTERDKIRKEIEETSTFIEVYVKASVKEARKRDPELYAMAEKGVIKHFTGISDPYEEPKKPELVLNTDKTSFEECAKKVVEYIKPLL